MYLRAGGCSSQALAGNFSITMGGNTVYIKGKQVSRYMWSCWKGQGTEEVARAGGFLLRSCKRPYRNFHSLR